MLKFKTITFISLRNKYSSSAKKEGKQGSSFVQGETDGKMKVTMFSLRGAKPAWCPLIRKFIEKTAIH